jgi:hypothetical protein
MSDSRGAGATSSAADRLRSAVAARTRAEVDEAVAIADLASEHEWHAGDSFDVIGVRPVRIGADGTELVDEFLPLEVATLKHISVGAATWLISDIVNLKARHPRLWERTLAGAIPVFRACQLAAEVSRCELTAEQARELDAELAGKLDGLPWRRVLQLARGLLATIAADRVAEAQRRAREQRYVRKSHTDDPAVSYLTALVDTRDAIFFDAMVDRIADILGDRGDTDPKDLRRARAIGILATPARAQLLLAEAVGVVGEVRATDPRLLPTTQLYVHVAEETLLRGAGTARIEGIGPLAATMLKHLIGESRIHVAPVIRPYAELAVDSYEIPEAIRRQVLLRDTWEIFPYSSRPARHQDLDHTVPYRRGKPRQTRGSNLGPLSRRPHRGKTHGDWRLQQPKPGVFWWDSPTADCYRVDRNGTTHFPPTPIGRELARTSRLNDRGLCASALEKALHGTLSRAPERPRRSGGAATARRLRRGTRHSR